MFTPVPSVEVKPITTRTVPSFIASAMALRASLLMLPSTTAICSRGMPFSTSLSVMSRTRLNFARRVLCLTPAMSVFTLTPKSV